MVGTACALALGHLEVARKKKIVLLESSPKRSISLPEGFSNRVSALNLSSVKLLKDIGAWDMIQEHRCNPIYKMRVWEACSDASITFESDDGEPLSFLVENDLTQMSLNAAMEACPNVTVLHGAKVDKYSIPGACKEAVPDDKVFVHLSNGDVVETQLLVGADGNRSLVRETLSGGGGAQMSWDYNQMGIVATVELEEETSNHTAFQRFLPTGPVAILPLNPRFSSLVWTLPVEQAKAMINEDESEFISRLEESLWTTSNMNDFVNTAAAGLDFLIKNVAGRKNYTELPPKIKGVKNRAGFPLGFGHSPRYCGPRTLLIGDAAHRVHPLAGQGVNLGYGDVRILANIIDESLREGACLGSKSYLHQYETETQRHNVPTMLAIDSLQKLYSSTFTPVVLARTLGLQLTDALTPLKKMAISHAAG